jgi:hypothetical protein
MEQNTPQLKFSPKKFIPMGCIVALGIFLAFSESASEAIYNSAIKILDFKAINKIIWVLAIPLGFFHFWLVTRKGRVSQNVLISTSVPFIDSLSSGIGLGTIISSSIELLRGIINQYVNGIVYFVNIDKIDVVSVFLTVIVLLVWSCITGWKLFKEAYFIQSHEHQNTDTQNLPQENQNRTGT